MKIYLLYNDSSDWTDDFDTGSVLEFVTTDKEAAIKYIDKLEAEWASMTETGHWIYRASLFCVEDGWNKYTQPELVKKTKEYPSE